MGWREEGRERVAERSAGNSLSIPEGENYVRVMPNAMDLKNGVLRSKGIQNPPQKEFRIHEKVGPKERMVACGKDIERNGECWLCDVKLPELAASENSKKQARAEEQSPKEKFIVQASLYDDTKDKFSIPKPWWVSNGNGIPGRSSAGSLATRLYSKLISPKRDFVDPIKGFNLRLEKTGSGKNTRYPTLESGEQVKVPVEILKLVKPMEEIVPQYSEKVQKDAYFGRESGDDEDQEEDRPVRSRPRSAQKSRKPADDDDDEVDEVEAEDADEDDAEEPEEAEDADDEDTDADDGEDEEPADDDDVEDSDSEDSADDESDDDDDAEAEDSDDEEPADDDDDEPPAKKKPVKKAAKKAPPAKKAAAKKKK